MASLTWGATALSSVAGAFPVTPSEDGLSRSCTTGRDTLCANTAMPLPGARSASPSTPNPIAMYLLGVCLRHGCAQDRELAFAWLALSAARACAYPTSMAVSSSVAQALTATPFGATSRRGSAAPQADAHGNPKRPSMSGPAQVWSTATRQSLHGILKAFVPLPIFELGSRYSRDGP
ncbi:hypothetical protein SeMB42_g05009 [Synchytrium endobioticum]|uniref:Secreted protein n=1 Tax=Synchytrium endobioticum TaxID=286115 RepID=A0A507CUC0_9FUNG|nr:hypothetical protein SeMB42_g05009 [Synchytrium endobioticum]